MSLKKSCKDLIIANIIFQLHNQLCKKLIKKKMLMRLLVIVRRFFFSKQAFVLMALSLYLIVFATLRASFKTDTGLLALQDPSR